MQLPIIFAIFCGLVWAAPQQPKAGVCGFESCNKPQPGKLNVHIVPHTHDDVGWGATIEQYYYRSVQYILDSVTDELIKDPNKKFIYVETAFFWMWWIQQTPEYQEKVKTIVNNGQLEFIGGSWSMHDEAATHYQSTIDQFTHGLRKLNDTFGYCGQPRVGWQIDPFGHARESASLMAQFYYDGLFFARLDWNDKNRRLNDKTMDMIWEADPQLGAKADLHTTVLYDHYSTPAGYCWDYTFWCSFNDPIVEDPEDTMYNLEQKITGFIDYAHKQAEHYNGNNIIILFGDDFQYQAARNIFKNIDKLIKYVNERQASGSDVNVFYSTPSCYLKAINDEGIELVTKQDDFFPYASELHEYWTGYFTSRATLKFFERYGNNMLQVGKQLAALTDGIVDNSKLEAMKGAMGVVQHHDGISGTEVQYVAEDYARLIASALDGTEEVIKNSLNYIMEVKSPQSVDLGLENCRLLNISQCAITAEKDTFLVTVYNPLSFAVDYLVRIPVQNASYTVQRQDDSLSVTQIVPIPEAVAKIPGRNSTTNVELLFPAQAVPALGYRTYYVTKTGDTPTSYSKVWVPQPGQGVSVGDATVMVTLDTDTRFLKSITTDGAVHEIKQTMQYYVGFPGNNSGSENRASGAYVFRPLGDSPHPIAERAEVTIVEGPLVTEIQQKFSDWATQIIRVFPKNKNVEIEWLVGPIDIDDKDGKEVILKYETPIQSNGIFFTDSMGRGDLQRKRDFRPTWDLTVDEPVAGNYYPVVSHITIEDGSSRLSVVNDRSQGGSSMRDGSVELMVHRRLLYTDNLIFEALNEQAFGTGLVVRGHHNVLIGKVTKADIRRQELIRASGPILLFSDVTGRTFQDIQDHYNLNYLGTHFLSLPVVMLTLEPWKENQLLIRLENAIPTSDNAPEAASVDLTQIFIDLEITGAREAALAGHKWVDEAQRLQWKKKGVAMAEPEAPENLDITNITINPQDIRTLIVDFKHK